VTCADSGRLAEVVSLDGPCSASVRTATGVEAVDTTLIASLSVGDLVVVHAGMTIALVPDEPR
jgi:hydrogenase maturation factor